MYDLLFQLDPIHKEQSHRIIVWGTLVQIFKCDANNNNKNNSQFAYSNIPWSVKRYSGIKTYVSIVCKLWHNV